MGRCRGSLSGTSWEVEGSKFGNSLKFGASFSSVLAVIPQGRAYVMYVLCDVSA